MHSPHLSRRHLLAGLAATTLAATAATYAHASDTSKDTILNDPEAPWTGAAKGDVTIVAFLDYNCPYCKSSTPDLDRLVREDGRIRLVYKDWPILGMASVHGAQMALAAARQGRYVEAHHALMGIPGRRVESEAMTKALETSGIDMSRLEADMTRHGDAIRKLLKRNMAQAESIGFQGTPAYLVGPFRVQTSLDYDGFTAAVKDARARQKAERG